MRHLIFIVALLSGGIALGQAGGPAPFHGGRASWARLKTASRYWDWHAEADHGLLRFLARRTSLNVDPVAHTVTAQSVADLSVYPFIFAESVYPLSSAERHHLGEYLRRGGFIFIDACINASVNPDMGVFLKHQLEVLDAELPGLSVDVLPETDPIYSTPFNVEPRPPSGQPGDTAPLRVLRWNGRTVGILSVSGIQCGRDGFGEPGAREACMAMTANIYIYAITH